MLFPFFQLQPIKNWGLGVAVALGLTACNTSQERAVCQRFKTGHFQFRHHEPGFQFQSLIERTGSIQTERDEISGDISTLAVKWTSDCEYELRLISSTKPFSDSIQQMRKTVPLHTEILGGTTDYYLFKCYRDNSDLVITDTMWVQK